jgi:hypothetical protein
MDPQTWLIIGVAIFVGLVFLYIIFKTCGGRLADLLSCYNCFGCFSGPCCDFWGTGGRIRPRDRDYPFGGYHNGFYNPFLRPQPQAQLPVIIVNNKDTQRGRRGRNNSDSDDSDRSRSDSDSEEDEQQKERKRVRRDQLERMKRVNDRDEYNVVV